MQLKFQYASDLHLEHYFENINKVRRLFVQPLIRDRDNADFLLLAGDVGRPLNDSYKTLIKELAPHYKRIFITTGNHEYYRMPSCETIAQFDEKCRQICANAADNITFLQNECYNINDWISIYGGTFWTDIPPEKRRIIESVMNDYSYIPDLTAKQTNDLHHVAVKGLEENLQSTNHKWIVMSHHMPSFDLIDEKYKTPANADLNYAFASDIQAANNERILAWVYGHTHTSRKCGKFYCNAVGYPSERSTNWSAQTFVVTSPSSAE